MDLDHALNLTTTVISSASAIAAATPTPEPDSWLGKLYRIIDFLAINFGRAKDKGNS